MPKRGITLSTFPRPHRGGGGTEGEGKRGEMKTFSAPNGLLPLFWGAKGDLLSSPAVA